MVTLRHSPGITGAFTYAGDTYRIEEGILEVPDEEIAAAMVADSHKISWVDDPAETYHCGVNGCSREVDSPSDTCWQHEK